MELGDTALADAFKKVNLEEVEFVSDELDNGLTLSLINNLIISVHAKKRGKERFGFRNDIEVDSEVRTALKNGKFVGLVPATDGNESYLYAYGKLGVHVSTDYQVVTTLVEYSQMYLSEVLKEYSEIRTAIINLQLKEMRKLNRKRTKLKKQVTENKLDFAIEIAELDRKIYRSKSEKAKKQYQERKELLINALENGELDLKDTETRLRKVGGALAFLNK